MANPLKLAIDVKPHERPMALLMGAHFFLVITAFWILKPIKKALFIAHYDTAGLSLGGVVYDAARAELLAKVLNVAVAFVATVAFSALSGRLRRHRLITLFGALFIATFAGFGALLSQPGAATVWCFYLLGDLFSTLMVATFFVMLNDIVTPQAARRLYGPIGIGGVLGGVVGSGLLRGFIDRVDPPAWMGVCCGLTLLMIVTAHLVGRSAPVPGPEPAPERARQSPLAHGARLVTRSRYLLSIVAIVGIYEMVSTILDFQFSATITHYCDGAEIGQQFATAFALMNGAALLVQLVLTGAVMNRFGLAVALLVLPATTLVGSGAFLVLPVLWVGTLIPTLDVAFAYSINQSAKEALYVPASADERTRGKAFIDMFFQRVAKAVAVLLTLALTGLVTDFATVRYLSLLSVALIAAWALAARHAGRHFDTIALELPTDEAARAGDAGELRRAA